jgi:hypothetical protein
VPPLALTAICPSALPLHVMAVGITLAITIATGLSIFTGFDAYAVVQAGLVLVRTTILLLLPSATPLKVALACQVAPLFIEYSKPPVAFTTIVPVLPSQSGWVTVGADTTGAS